MLRPPYVDPCKADEGLVVLTEDRSIYIHRLTAIRQDGNLNDWWTTLSSVPEDYARVLASESLTSEDEMTVLMHPSLSRRPEQGDQCPHKFVA